MTAKYLHLLANDNTDLRKQVGCMTGVFHIFNRHHIVAGRHILGHSPKRSRPGSMLFSNRTPDRESSVIYRSTPMMEKHRASTESSKDSFSSWSPPSPFSYLDSSTSGQMNHQSVDLRDVVKDSMCREAHGLSHKTINKKESSKWYCDEGRELSRSKSCQFKDGLPFSVSKDYPRFSFDGRETDHLSIKTVKELPRLSFNSKERSIRTLNSVSLVPIKPSDSKPNPHSQNSKIDADKDLIETRPPSVVAKLMGLETYPNSTSTSVNVSEKCESVIKMPNSLRDPASPCWKNPNMKPISRVPIEAAPWKQRDGARVITPTTKVHSPVSSVYGEVDKRLKNLEFARSGKDLRALKQILEAMNAIEARKGEREDTAETSSDNHRQHPQSDYSKAHDSHIVIMKPAKLVGKGSTNNKAGKDENSERRSRLRTSFVDSSKARKQSNKQHSESRLLSGRRQPSNFEQSNDLISGKVKNGRVLKMDIEINASEYSEETNSRQSSTSTPEKSTLHVKVGEQLNPEYPSPVSVLDDSVYMENLPSPVKCTPNTRKDDINKTPTEESVKDRYEGTNDVSSDTNLSGVSSQTNSEKLRKIQDLVQKLKRFNSSHDETHTDYIASLSENTNPNDRYISEILLASGLLLRDLESFEFHPSGHPMNPTLFIVLEHTKFRNMQDEKFHRKLIFDAVNELLVGKLSSGSKIMQNPRTLLRELCIEIEELQMPKKRDACNLEVDGDDLKHILCEDVLKKSETWTGFYGESPMIVLEVERLIFRDLVDEIVMSEACRGC